MGDCDWNKKCNTPCNPPVIVRGQDKILDVFLRSQKTRQPVDLTAATEIVAVLGNADGTAQEYKLSLSQVILVSGGGGHIQAVMPASGTALLALTTIADDGTLSTGVQVNYFIGGKKTIVNAPGTVMIEDPLFPTAP